MWSARANNIARNSYLPSEGKPCLLNHGPLAGKVNLTPGHGGKAVGVSSFNVTHKSILRIVTHNKASASYYYIVSHKCSRFSTCAHTSQVHKIATDE
jgi:hypothetical protein